jgi:hypothetical protein
MAFRPVPWKRNYNKVPPSVRAALDEIDTEFFIVAATKKIPKADIERGIYAHLGIVIEGDQVVCGEPALPPADSGKWSGRNADGWDLKRTDWPMVQKTYVFETPNFGDASTYGTHMHVWTREVYQHQVFEPQGMTISSELLNEAAADHVLIKFAVDPFLSKDQPEFEMMLLWALNVLQENTGVTGVFSSDADRQAFLGTIQLDWQVFPPGTIEEVIARLQSAPANAHNAPDFDQHVRERVVLFNRLNPRAYLRGQGGFGSYFGAQFDDDLVVFENLKYGNALYVLYEDWNEVSRRSRLDLLRDHDANFDRIIHTEDWEDRFTTLLRKKMRERRRRRQ